MRNSLRYMSATLIAIILMSIGTIGLNVSAAATDDSESPFSNYYDEPQYSNGSDIYGDVDCDGALKVKDATLIQKQVANMVVFNTNQALIADVDGDSDITVKDATAVQKAVAKIINGVPMSRVYTWDMSANSMAVSLPGSGHGKITLKVSRAGYYDFSVKNAQSHPDFLITMPTANGGYSGHDSLSVYLSKGTHEINLYNDKLGAFNTSVSFSFSETFTRFDISKAVEASAKPISVSVGTPYVLLKVKGAEFTDSVRVESEGVDPKISGVYVYDSSLSLVSDKSLKSADSKNISGVIPAYSYFSDYYYVYITHSTGGTAYSLTCASVSQRLIHSADSLGVGKSVTVSGKYIETDYSDYSVLDACYKFTPDKKGYYKFSLSGGSYGNLNYDIFTAKALSEGIDSPLCSKEFVTETGTLNLYDVESLMANETYYIAVSGVIYGNAEVSLEAVASNESEYKKAHENDTASDKSQIIANSKTLRVGDSVSVETLFEDDTRWFKFTAGSDMRIVICSLHSYDAYLRILDSDFVEIGRFDDIRKFDSRDFSVLGNVKSGETYYLGASSYQAKGDFYTLSLVSEKNYKPLS